MVRVLGSAIPEGDELTMLRDHGHLELTPLGPASWRVSDRSVPAHEVTHVVAFVEGRDADVEVVWLRGCIDAPGRFEDLDSALDSIAAATSRPTPPAPAVSV
jgi:hypothetical protein